MVDIGKFRNQIEIFTVVSTADGIGGFTKESTSIGVYWCKVDEKPVSLLVNGDHKDSVSYIKVLLRKEVSVNYSDIIRYKGNDYSVIDMYANKDNPDEFSTIECIL